MVKKGSFLLSEPEKTEIQEHSRETRLMEPQTELGSLMLGSPGKMFRLPSIQTQVTSKRFRNGSYSCNGGSSTVRWFFKRVVVLTLVDF